MALSDNPFIGLPAADLIARRDLWLRALDDIARVGRSHAFPGLSVTRADIPQILDTLRLLRVAIDVGGAGVTGAGKQIAQVTINTSRKFTGRAP